MSIQAKMVLIDGKYYAPGHAKAKEFLSRTMEPGATPSQTQPLLTHNKSEGLKTFEITAVKVGKKMMRLRQDTKPLLNKLETEFQAQLKTMFPRAIIIPQSMRFKLANGLWYKPDFIAVTDSLRVDLVTVSAFEVKGPFAHRGGFENLKMAAHQFPWVRWALIWKEEGLWREQEILP